MYMRYRNFIIIIIIIYVRSRSGRATIFHLLPGGIHCIYLKSRDHKSAIHLKRTKHI
jgi:hypothetical protein